MFQCVLPKACMRSVTSWTARSGSNLAPPNTIIKLDNYITGFSVTSLNQLNSTTQLSYLYLLSITGESDVAISDSPAYSVHTAPNVGTGTNVSKTLSSNVFLRNVYYGS